MKKILLITAISLLTLSCFSQDFTPLKLSIYPDSSNVAFYGGFSLDKGNGASIINNLSNSVKSGFVVNARYKKRNQKQKYQQFMLDISPVIVNWDPFSWNKLAGQPVDSFATYKMPFAEDALLHVGWHYNSLQKIRGTQINSEFTLWKIFSEFYFTPYNLYGNEESGKKEYRYSCFNLCTGIMRGYVKKEVPTLGNFLIGFSAQLNVMAINELDEFENSFQSLTDMSDNLFIGPGCKLSMQTNYINIYVEGKHFFGLHSGESFTNQPVVIVGVFGNLNWQNKKNHPSQTNSGNYN